MLDALIIGGGPAGLSAALVLGRSRRRVVLIDAARPRNRGTRAVHGFLTRDGVPPGELRALAHAEIARYPDARVIPGEVTTMERGGDAYRAGLADGSVHEARCALIAIGQSDRLPTVPGLAEHYGRGVYFCPYCDAWEHADGLLVALGAQAHGLALKLRRWSSTVVWLSEGADAPSSRGDALEDHQVIVHRAPLRRVDGGDADLVALTLADGTRLRGAALFLEPQREPLPPWIGALGCSVAESGAIVCDQRGATGVPGLYVAGDASGGAQFAIAAAAEGARAAVAIDDRLRRIELGEAPA
ncbi:MAG TPA: NAD(P)/FAD-dependent oxidoreductase [Planctomycetota bacterium]|nr:NAD(P)/FAD-dependent oxidoreductase [Planctomycetota bacterium]